MTDNRTTELEQSRYKPPYDARPMRMLRHHIECDCLATRRGVLREIEDLFAIELEKRDKRIAELEQAIAATLGNPEIVRCRDCGMYESGYNHVTSEITTDGEPWCYRLARCVEPDNFCCWAERRDA